MFSLSLLKCENVKLDTQNYNPANNFMSENLGFHIRKTILTGRVFETRVMRKILGHKWM
jgi:hypothetical protein